MLLITIRQDVLFKIRLLTTSMLPSFHPYIIIPNLIPQPTWGGDYISHLKCLNKLVQPNSELSQLGQSYELFSGSKLSGLFSSRLQPTLEIGNPTDPNHTRLIVHKDNPISIQELILSDPENILGKRYLQLQGKKIDILIKLTQAQENSYQLHVSESVGKWQAKPESWYFLQPGLISLGVKPGISWDEFQQTCWQVYEKSLEISIKIKKHQLTLDQGTRQLQTFIKLHSPQTFVNRLQVPKNAAVDLSSGNLHHSWEANHKTHPQSNIVYELQKNVYDPVSTIRCYDQGKFKSDGSIRDLNLDDYFRFIDRSLATNDPQTHFIDRIILKKSSTQTIRQIFNTKFYRLQEIVFSKPVSNQFTTTDNSFHHLFVRQGSLKLFFQDKHWTVTSGFSIFVPAGVGQYTLKPYQSKSVKVLKTYL